MEGKTDIDPRLAKLQEEFMIERANTVDLLEKCFHQIASEVGTNPKIHEYLEQAVDAILKTSTLKARLMIVESLEPRSKPQRYTRE